MESFIGLVVVIIIVALLIFFKKPISAEAEHCNDKVMVSILKSKPDMIKQLKKLEKDFDELGEFPLPEDIINKYKNRGRNNEKVNTQNNV